MRFTLPTFPDEVSAPIDMPDIGELLMYPMFQCMPAEGFLKYATDFQKYLFSKVPLRNDKKFVTIRSSVHLLEPNSRSHTGAPNGLAGWHVDGASEFDHIEPTERVFILSSACKSLTEFNVTPIEFDRPNGETVREFTRHINLNPYDFVGKQIEPNRIYTFENHIHRAVEPSRIEFRYFLRVLETDHCDYIADKPLDGVHLRDAHTGEYFPNVQYGNRSVTVFFPRTMTNLCHSLGG